MTYSPLNDFLLSQLFSFLLIFCRTGSAVMLLPGFGEAYIAPRIRLLFALALAILLTPLLTSKIPAMPASGLGLGVLMIGEILIGLFIGTLARTILAAIHTTGTMISLQTSLSSAIIFDPTNAIQSSVVSNLLTITALTLFFTLNLHHYAIAALVQSYDIFTPGHFPDVGDMNQLELRTFSNTFTLGIMLASPHIVYGLLFYMAGGLMNRLMSSFQVFFVMMSPQILIGMLLLFAIIPMLMRVFTGYMEDQFSHFLVPI